MKQSDPVVPDPKFQVKDLVRVSDRMSPFFRWEMGVEKRERLRHPNPAGKLTEVESWFYTCSHAFILTRPNDVTLNLFFREDQLEEVPF